MYSIRKISGPVGLILLMIIGFVVGLTIVHFIWTSFIHPQPEYTSGHWQGSQQPGLLSHWTAGGGAV